MAENLEQFLLSTPPPRRLRWTLLQDSPVGKDLRRILVGQLVCLGLAPLPCFLPASWVKSAADFVPILDPPELWLAIFLLLPVALMIYARSLRKRFSLAETGQVVQGRLLSQQKLNTRRWVWDTTIHVDTFCFQVGLPDGTRTEFRSESQNSGTWVSRLREGDPLLVLFPPGKYPEGGQMLGLLNLEESTAALRRLPRTHSLGKLGAGVAAVFACLGLMTYAILFWTPLTTPGLEILFPCLAVAVASLLAAGWALRRAPPGSSRWLLLPGSAVLAPLVLVMLGWTLNCGLDFATPTWTRARVLRRDVRMLSPQAPFRIGHLKLSLGVEVAVRASRVDSFGEEVEVRINRGLFGYPWIGDVRPVPR